MDEHNPESDADNAAAVVDPTDESLDELDFSDLEDAEHESAATANGHERFGDEISALFDRVSNLLDGELSGGTFRPIEPESPAEAGLNDEALEKFVLRLLLHKGSAQGRQISGQLCLPFHLVDPVLKQLKQDQILAGGAAEMGDYEYSLSIIGRERAQRFFEECGYCGPAPVPLNDYLKAMAAQSIAGHNADEETLRQAFTDLVVSDRVLDRLGPAVNSGRGMFIFGSPGNGKTSIAERITRCFGSTIWIPRTLGVEGDIIRLFDPGVHQPVEQAGRSGLLHESGVDDRWVQIVRPTVVAGGELTMAELEVTQNPYTKICEAPLQLKSNCGTLLIDDFGRQCMSVNVLLNRWIVPLEKRYDFLNLPSGKKVQVPFDQLIIFATNLEPRDLVDEAFLRRIPYKIEVHDPTVDEFREMFRQAAPRMGFRYDDGLFEYLVETHYRQKERSFRACHARDLLLQVRNYCIYKQTDKQLSTEALDFAVESYFSVM